MKAEGWYRDPNGIHTDRWFSNGEPSSLVRDNGEERYDPPPETHFSSPLVEAEGSEPGEGGDLRRADEEESRSRALDLRRADDSAVAESYVDAALDAGAESGTGFD
jgi:hypothetical protein